MVDDNDRTVGRTNVRPGATPAPPRPVAAAAPRPPAPFPAADGGMALTPAPAAPAPAAASPGGTTAAFEWPTDAAHYRLSERIGQGAFASVWQARTRRPGAERAGGDDDDDDDDGALCAVKIMDLEHVNINISDIRLEVQTMRLSAHPNVLICHTSFVRDTDLWLVTQLMSKGSSLHCLQRARAQLLAEAAAASAAPCSPFSHAPDDAVLEGGLSAHAALVDPEALLFEDHITYILHETLLGLQYIHDNGQIHRDVKAGNILLDGGAHVRIADFGVSSWLVDGGSRRDRATTFVGTPCWMAPEVMEQVDGYDGRADIWSLGITALELCKGYAPYARFAPMKVLLRTIQEEPPDLATYDDGDDVQMWSAPFRALVGLCLQKDPRQRPTCRDLLAHRHFAPLARADGREAARDRMRAELCDAVKDVGGDGRTAVRRGTLPGATPVRIVATAKKDRPAGTSWILPGGSEVDAAMAIAAGDDGREEFFAEFEQLTGGENFNRDSVHVSELHAADAGARSREHSPAKTKEQLKKKEEEDDMNDFFDEFEKATGGENFRRPT